MGGNQRRELAAGDRAGNLGLGSLSFSWFPSSSVRITGSRSAPDQPPNSCKARCRPRPDSVLPAQRGGMRSGISLRRLGARLIHHGMNHRRRGNPNLDIPRSCRRRALGRLDVTTCSTPPLKGPSPVRPGSPGPGPSPKSPTPPRANATSVPRHRAGTTAPSTARISPAVPTGSANRVTRGVKQRHNADTPSSIATNPSERPCVARPAWQPTAVTAPAAACFVTGRLRRRKGTGSLVKPLTMSETVALEVKPDSSGPRSDSIISESGAPESGIGILG